MSQKCAKFMSEAITEAIYACEGLFLRLKAYSIVWRADAVFLYSTELVFRGNWASDFKNNSIACS